MCHQIYYVQTKWYESRVHLPETNTILNMKAENSYNVTFNRSKTANIQHIPPLGAYVLVNKGTTVVMAENPQMTICIQYSIFYHIHSEKRNNTVHCQTGSGSTNIPSTFVVLAIV